MDSLTQAVLGGATALVVTGGRSPRKAILWGAAIATLPDLDILVLYENQLEKLVAHRTWSHSWFSQSAIAPLLAFLLCRFETKWSFATWWIMIWLVLLTHSGLDALTVFGTDLFWPLAETTIIGGSVFIIDPIYTLLLLIPCLFALFRPASTRLLRTAVLMLMLSSAYLIWGLAAKTVITNKAVEDLAVLGIKAEKVLVQATPFNTALWRILVIDDDAYYEGFHSVFDNDDAIKFSKYKRNINLLKELENSKSLLLLKRFNHDFFSVYQKDNAIVVTDLRMGVEPVYSFQFQIAEINNVGIQPTSPKMMARPSIPADLFSKILHRIFNQD